MITCKASTFNLEALSQQSTVTRCLACLEVKYPYHSQRKKCIAIACCSSNERQKCSTKSHLTQTSHDANRAQKLQKEEKEKEGERKVHCEVEVISWRERRIKAQILVYADIQSVWNAITDYERLADFIPNLVWR